MSILSKVNSGPKPGTFAFGQKKGTKINGHGLSKTPAYRSWKAMNNRCRNKSQKDWHLYGGRGISICKRWESFENFFADMGPRPSGFSLDRIDPLKDYGPTNCRWATRREQSLNRSSAKLVTIIGKTQNLSLWFDELGINAQTYKARRKRGWSLEKALLQPIKKTGRLS